jgi:four helix bundle protein|tara:strand:+ start:83 stop:415 length:333 start_codon:yes stop_codon:yes gene_type:complete
MKSSPLFVKTYDFAKWLLEHTNKFPKSQRFVMAKRIENAILDFQDNLIKAVKLKNKQTYFLIAADIELEKLRKYIRLCQDLKLLSFKQYEYASIKSVEIGKMLGKWIKGE